MWYDLWTYVQLVIPCYNYMNMMMQQLGHVEEHQKKLYQELDLATLHPGGWFRKLYLFSKIFGQSDYLFINFNTNYYASLSPCWIL